MKILKSHKIVGVRNLNIGKDISTAHSTNQEPEVIDAPIIIEDSSTSHAETVVSVQNQPQDLISELHEKYQDDIAILNQKLEMLTLDHIALNDKITLERKDQFNKERQLGYEEGFAEGFQKTEEMRISLADLLVRFEGSFKASLIDIRPIVIELIFSSLTKIIGDKYRDEKYIKKIIDVNIKKLRLSDGIKVTIDERDYNLLAKNAADGEDNTFFSQFNFVCSSSIEAGGCIIETDTGGLDARLSVQLAELKKVLMATVAQ